MVFGNCLLTFLITCSTLANGYEFLSCAESLPTSWKFEGDFPDQIEFKDNCYKECALKKHDYFAVGSSSNECYCGDELAVINSDKNNNHNSHNSHNNNHNNNSNHDVNDDNEHYHKYEEEVCGRSSFSYSLFSVEGSSNRIYRRDGQEEETTKVVTQLQSAVVNTAASTRVVTPTNDASNSASPSTQSGSQNDAASTIVQTKTGTGTGTGTGSGTAKETGTLVSSTVTNDDHGTTVVYSSVFKTQGGQTVSVFQTVTPSSTPTASPNQNNDTKRHHKNVNVGAIVGGVVGGVGGAALLTVLILLLVRHLNKRREQERMEQEYQEAIKPVDFGGFGTRGGSTKGGASGHGIPSRNNTIDKAPQETNTSVVSLNQGPSSSSIDEEWRDGFNTGQLANPFDDSRRISDHSYRRESSPARHKILTVVNPDEEDY